MSRITLPPTKCTFVSSKWPDWNFAGNANLYAGVNAKGYAYRILLGFDFDALPEEETPVRALLNMYDRTPEPLNQSVWLTAHKITEEWSERAVTWRYQPPYDPACGEAAPVEGQGWYRWDVTDAVLRGAAGRRDCRGLLLKSAETGTDDIRRFCSPSEGCRCPPHLEIDCEGHGRPQPEFPCAAVRLASRRAQSISECHFTQDACRHSAWRDTSVFSCCTFFVFNDGENPASAFLQISPDGGAALDEPPALTVAPGCLEAFVPRKFGFFTRLAFRAPLPGRHTKLKIWMQAQV